MDNIYRFFSKYKIEIETENTQVQFLYELPNRKLHTPHLQPYTEYDLYSVIHTKSALFYWLPPIPT